MAVVSPTRYPGMMASKSDIVEEPPVQVVEDKIYIAVGKDLKESKLTVSWGLHNSGGKKICILHVLKLAQRIPLMGTKFPVSQLEEQRVREYRETERQDMNKLLLDYTMFCDQAGVCVDVLHIERNSIEEGIVELISQYGIKKLVMGAAADKHYSKKMMEPKSKKAIYVRQRAPLFCHIWFICKGNLVHTRKYPNRMAVASLTPQACSNNETGQFSSLRSLSVTEGQRNQLNLTSSDPDYRRVRSDGHGMRISTLSSDRSGGLTPRRSSNTEGSFNGWDEALARGKEELEKMKRQVDEVLEKLPIAQMVLELEEKYKKERDDLQVERDNALKEAEELRSKQAEEASNALTPQFFSEFSLSEIEEATCNFDPSLEIGKGGYGTIYKGRLRHTQVAIKKLHSHGWQGPSEFQQEVDILSKLRHPNLVTLIGACPEAWILVYEYLPNGSLEDRLSCKDNTPPLTWQTRIRFAAELCSVLIFLHSSKPHSTVHCDLKPANILVDANYVSKLSDFGICRVITQNKFSGNNNTTLCYRTDPKGTIGYMDPEYFQTGELTPKSDVYSFGIILLRLLTGRPALGITKEVQCALDKENLKDLLDPTAGDWPVVQAKQLADLALRCCAMNRRNRPDLASEVWRVLEPMRASCGG